MALGSITPKLIKPPLISSRTPAWLKLIVTTATIQINMVLDTSLKRRYIPQI